MAGDHTFAKVCAEQDVKAITLIEDHGQAALTAPVVETETLARAGVMLLEARGVCYRGQVAEAVALYDKIIVTLGPIPERHSRRPDLPEGARRPGREGPHPVRGTWIGGVD
jgi:hypothetical protein